MFKKLNFFKDGKGMVVSPNIIKLYEFYRDEKCFYLISEFCEYGDMFDP